MPSIKEILEIEQHRESIKDIYLFAEGTFWRAYEKSAWLCVRCINEFKVTKRQIKGVEFPVCFVGFPQSSTEKWLSDELEVAYINDKHIVVSLPDDKLPCRLWMRCSRYGRAI